MHIGLHGLLIGRQPVERPLSRGAVRAHVRHPGAPPARLGIEPGQIQLRLLHAEPGDEREEEAVGHVVDTTLDLALGLRPVGPAQHRAKGVVLGQRPERILEAVAAASVGVAPGDYRAHVVIEDFARNAAEILKHPPMTGEQGLTAGRVDILKIHPAAVAQYRDETVNLLAEEPVLAPVHLHLVTRHRLVARHWLGRRRRIERRDKAPHRTFSARVAHRRDLPAQDRRRNPVRTRRLNATPQPILVARQLPRASRASLRGRRGPNAAQIVAHRVARDIQFPGNRPDAKPSSVQDQNLQNRLLLQHVGLLVVGDQCLPKVGQ